MNEKIKQLADQARVLADEFQEQWKAGPSNEEFFQEKFAQSIVRECMNICYRTDTEYEGHKVKSTVIASKVAEHFGVEE